MNIATDELDLTGSGVSRFLESRKLNFCYFMSLNSFAFGPGTFGLESSDS